MNIWPFILLFLIIGALVIFMILQWDADEMWQRQERSYRRKGLVTQRPDTWEQTARLRKAGAIGFVVVIALWFAYMIINIQ